MIQRIIPEYEHRDSVLGSFANAVDYPADYTETTAISQRTALHVTCQNRALLQADRITDRRWDERDKIAGEKPAFPIEEPQRFVFQWGVEAKLDLGRSPILKEG